MSLLDCLSIRKIHFKNRLLASAPVYSNARRTGDLSTSIVETIFKCIDFGLGGVVLDSVYIASQGKSTIGQLGLVEENLSNYKKLTKYSKERGVVLGIRLTHCGAKTSEQVCGEQPISSSENTSFGKEYGTSRSFDKNDVEEILMYFKHSAELAEEAGFEIIEINGGSQELLAQCFHPKFNQRKDSYGGSVKNRLKLVRKIISAVKTRTNKALISYYFPIYDRQGGIYSPQVLKQIYQALEEAGLDIFHPTIVQVLKPVFKSEDTILHWSKKMTKKNIIADGNINIKALVLINDLNIADLVTVGDNIYSAPNWYDMLQKKIR